MPFKDKGMTTKDQQNQPVRVVSTASGNDMDVASIPTPNKEDFVETEKVDLSSIEEQEISKTAQAVKGVEPDQYVGFSKGQPLSKINARDLDNFMASSVIARPVRLPSKLNARSKDPNWRLRWVEFKAEDGRRYSDCLEMGFVNASKDDVVGLQVKINSDGTIKADDLILMKIQTEVINGYLKHNALKAMKMVSKTGVKQMAQSEGNKILREGAMLYDENDLRHKDQNRRASYGEYRDKLEIF